MHTKASQNPNPNPHLQPMQAFHFLHLLSRINRPPPRPSALAAASHSRKVRLAAYTSMAYVAGPRRAWSRALLRSLRRRSGNRCLGKRGERRAGILIGSKVDRAGELRRIVPGGKRMDLCNLLEETRNYIQCLSSQVKVMQGIIDSCPV